MCFVCARFKIKLKLITQVINQSINLFIDQNEEAEAEDEDEVHLVSEFVDANGRLVRLRVCRISVNGCAYDNEQQQRRQRNLCPALQIA